MRLLTTLFGTICVNVRNHAKGRVATFLQLRNKILINVLGLVISSWVHVKNLQGICKLDSGGEAVLEHCPHRTAPLPGAILAMGRCGRKTTL